MTLLKILCLCCLLVCPLSQVAGQTADKKTGRLAAYLTRGSGEPPDQAENWHTPDYDAAGRCTGRHHRDADFTYQYDLRDRLHREIRRSSGTKREQWLHYDQDGRRASQHCRFIPQPALPDAEQTDIPPPAASSSGTVSRHCTWSANDDPLTINDSERGCINCHYDAAGRITEQYQTQPEHTPNSLTVSLVHNYRVGGVMYRVCHLGPVAAPGQQVEFGYVDAGLLGKRELSFRIEDQPPMTL